MGLVGDGSLGIIDTLTEYCLGYIAPLWYTARSLFIHRGTSASHAAPLVSHGEYASGTDSPMDGRQTVTSCFLLWTQPA